MRTMNDQDTFAFENREYVSPTVSRDEQLGFIDNFRDVRNKNVARINADTYNLGTQVPSIRGGLGGSNATFESRYVTPYVNSTIQGLKTTAQQTALTQALENLQAQYKQRYNEAYRAAKARANAGGGGSGDTPDIPQQIEDDTRKTQTEITNNIPGTIAADTGAGVVWTNLSDGSFVKKENYPSLAAGRKGLTINDYSKLQGKGLTLGQIDNLNAKIKSTGSRVYYSNGVPIGYGPDANHITLFTK